MSNSISFIDIGYGNIVSASRIISISPPEPAPIRRLVQDGKEAGAVIDASAGHKTQSVIMTDSNFIILSSLSPEELLEKLNSKSEDNDSNLN